MTSSQKPSDGGKARSGGLRERLAGTTEERLGRALSELLDNSLLTGAIERAFDAREKAAQAQQLALGALNIPSAADIERLTRRLRSVSQRLEGIEDGVHRLDRALAARGVDRSEIGQRLSAIEERLGALSERLGRPSAAARRAEPEPPTSNGTQAPTPIPTPSSRPAPSPKRAAQRAASARGATRAGSTRDPTRAKSPRGTARAAKARKR
jgi:hypothetical protein